MFIGGIITWKVAKVYYERASVEFSKETALLRTMVNGLGRALEDAGMVKIKRDESGNILEVINVRVDIRPAHIRATGQHVEVTVTDED
jgi:hypothetical protein